METTSKISELRNAVGAISAAIRHTRYMMLRRVNGQAFALYYAVGGYLCQRSSTARWGDKVLETIAAQLQQELPGLHGFSAMSMKRMKRFYTEWEGQFGSLATTQTEIGSLPMTQLQFGPLATDQLDSDTLRAFLSVQFTHHSIIINKTDSLDERLFYNRRLRSLVAIELKWGAFRPEYAGKMNFYLSALDDMVRLPGENPSVGIVLCRDQKQKIVEYALRDTRKPMGVATYRAANELPETYRNTLGELDGLKELI